MHTYQVGQLYHPGRTRWPEVTQFLWRGELELLLFLAAPTDAEIAAIRRGHAEFALYDRDRLCVLLYCFSPLIDPSGGRRRRGLPWSDAPFHQGMMPPEHRAAPLDPATFTPETRVLLHVILVRADGGQILVLRTVSLPPELTRRLFAVIAVQDAAPFNQATYDRQLAELYRTYPTTDALLAASGAIYRGGE